MQMDQAHESAGNKMQKVAFFAHIGRLWHAVVGHGGQKSACG
jgi:hypothetical protein